MAKKRFGLLTGGGDVPGLKNVIRALAYQGIDSDYDVVGIKRGYGGLVYHDPNEPVGTLTTNIERAEHYVLLTKETTADIYTRGGTVLHTSRVYPAQVKSIRDVGPNLQRFRGLKLDQETDLTEDVLRNIARLGLDCLVVIGGDDTLKYAVALHN